MNSLTRAWRQFRFGRKFSKCGKRCVFFGKHYQFEGNIEVGDHCRFRDNVILRTEKDGKIIFNSRTGAANYVIIEATKHVEIGSMTWLSEFVVIRDTTHLVHGTTEHWRYTPHVAMPVTIGQDCWIGSRVYIGPGVTIGRGVVIGSGSVIKERETIGDYEIWAGVPARRLMSRTDPVAPERQAQYDALFAKFGVGEDRYNFEKSG